jgi:hypothetical protein
MLFIHTSAIAAYGMATMAMVDASRARSHGAKEKRGLSLI